MDATHLHCPRCSTIRPIRFEALLPGEPALGTSVLCGHCHGHAFTLLKPARFYCDICDDVQPALLERVELAHPGEGAKLKDLAVLLVCGCCFDGKATLYASPTRPRRYADAGASGRTARELPAGRARRG